MSSQPSSAEPIIDQDLVELQPDKQSLFKRLIAPKVIILTFLSLIFVSKNIYNIYVIGPPVTPIPQPKETEKKAQQSGLMDRMYGYAIITVILFTLYMILVKVNDRQLMRKMQEQQKLAKQKQAQNKNTAQQDHQKQKKQEASSNKKSI